MYRNSPLSPTGHWPFGAAAQKGRKRETNRQPMRRNKNRLRDRQAVGQIDMQAVKQIYREASSKTDRQGSNQRGR